MKKLFVLMLLGSTVFFGHHWSHPAYAQTNGATGASGATGNTGTSGYSYKGVNRAHDRTNHIIDGVNQSKVFDGTIAHVGPSKNMTTPTASTPKYILQPKTQPANHGIDRIVVPSPGTTRTVPAIAHSTAPAVVVHTTPPPIAHVTPTPAPVAVHAAPAAAAPVPAPVKH
jgi:hypothetical protein